MPVERAPKSRVEIERIVLHELRSADGCEGAAGISIVGWENVPDERPNWTVLAYDSGTADDHECELALMTIVSRLQSFYELVQKH